LSDRTFVVRQNSNRSKYFNNKADVPRGSDIAPFLYSVFTHNIPNTSYTKLVTYADDTAITASNENSTIVSSMIRQHLNIIHLWTKRWKIKINKSKSSYITFTLKRETCPPVTFNNIPIPVYTETKYLGLILDRRLTWASHIKNKRRALNSRLHLFKPLLRSKMNIKSKTFIYKLLLKPLWNCGIQLWGAAKPSNLATLQSFQSICLRLIYSSPWYVTNKNLNKDFRMEPLNKIAKNFYNKYHNKIQSNNNPLISKLSSNKQPNNPIRRLKRKWCKDL
jgi:hypothetical protein